jgi:hypothetical protein
MSVFSPTTSELLYLRLKQKRRYRQLNGLRRCGCGLVKALVATGMTMSRNSYWWNSVWHRFPCFVNQVAQLTARELVYFLLMRRGLSVVSLSDQTVNWMTNESGFLFRRGQENLISSTERKPAQGSSTIAEVAATLSLRLKRSFTYHSPPLVPWWKMCGAIPPLSHDKVKLSLCSTNLSTTSRRCMGEWMYRSTFPWPRHSLEVSGQLHTPAALTPVLIG